MGFFDKIFSSTTITVDDISGQQMIGNSGVPIPMKYPPSYYASANPTGSIDIAQKQRLEQLEREYIELQKAARKTAASRGASNEEISASRQVQKAPSRWCRASGAGRLSASSAAWKAPPESRRASSR